MDAALNAQIQDGTSSAFHPAPHSSLRYLSVCSGIEAASVAWEPLGWQPVGFSEIEPFPSAVLAHHWPDIPNLGDLTKHHDWPSLRPDLIVGGTPCQAFSVAGLRKGLEDPRGNLTLVFLGLLARERPRWVVWENVPGVLSDKTGAFGAFLGGLAELGYGFAYRVLDAQFFGVAQRRRRVFVVGYFGDWRRAAAVLFEPDCLCGDSPPSREAGKGIAAGFECGPQGGGFTDIAPTLDARCKDGPIRNQIGAGVMIPEVAGCLNSSGGHAVPGNSLQDATAHQLIPVHTTGAGFWKEGFGTLRAREQDSHENLIAHTLRGEGFDASEDGTGRGTPIVPVAFSCKDHGADAGPISPTLRSMGHDGSHANGGGQVAVAFEPRCARNGRGMPSDVVPALKAEAGSTGKGDAAPCVAFAQNTRDEVREMAVVGALAAQPGMKQTSYIRQSTAVRRLTPTECERLQGFPDNHTLIPWRGKPAADCPDGPRYKALGNSMAVPVMRWIGERIQSINSL